jgi:hypothetical protein
VALLVFQCYSQLLLLPEPPESSLGVFVGLARLVVSILAMMMYGAGTLPNHIHHNPKQMAGSVGKPGLNAPGRRVLVLPRWWVPLGRACCCWRGHQARRVNKGPKKTSTLLTRTYVSGC